MIKRTGMRAPSVDAVASGEVSSVHGDVSPSQALGRVLEELRRSRLTDQSTHRMTELLVRLTIFLDKGLRLGSVEQVSADHVSQFIRASVSTPTGHQRPSVATMHLRRSALRLYFRTLRQLGLYDGDPTIDLALPPRSCLAVRPLTGDEIVVCRSFSLQTLTATKQPAAWALAEATARTSEIPHIVVSDLDFATVGSGSTGVPRRRPGGDSSATGELPSLRGGSGA